jgi:hypothetical protein
MSPWLVDKIPIPLPHATGLISFHPTYHLLDGFEKNVTTGISSLRFPVTYKSIARNFFFPSSIVSYELMNLYF